MTSPDNNHSLVGDPSGIPPHLVAAIPYSASGPGWSNSLVLLLWVTAGEYSVEYVQPEDQPDDVRVLHPIAAQAVGQVTRSIAHERGLTRWGTS